MHRKKLVKDKGEEQEFIKGFSQNKVVHELRILQKKKPKKKPESNTFVHSTSVFLYSMTQNITMCWLILYNLSYYSTIVSSV